MKNVFLGLLFVCTLISCGENKKEIVIPELSKKSWIDLTPEQKHKVFYDFTEAKEDFYFKQFLKLNNVTLEALKAYVKYPETLEVYFLDNWVKPNRNIFLDKGTFSFEDREKGLIKYRVSIRSENNLSLKVRNELEFIIQYDGTSNFNIISIEKPQF